MQNSAFVVCSYRALALLLVLLYSHKVTAQPATLSFTDCTSGNAIDPSQKINVSTVYGQIVTNEILGRHLNLTVIGNTGQDILPISNETGLLCESIRSLGLFVTLTVIPSNVIHY